MEEKTINFKVDAELYRFIKIRVAELGISLKAYVLGLIISDLDKEYKEK